MTPEEQDCYDALAAELASIKAHSKFQADCGRQTSLALIDAGIRSFGFNADGVKELAAERDALRSRLAEAEELRDWWHARAISLFWNPGDETTCAVVRNDAALAMEWIKSRAPDSAPTALTCEHGNMVGGCVACALADSAPGAAPAARYRLQNKCDPYRLVDFDAKRWNLIVVPANQPDGAA